MSKLDVLKENGTYNPRHEKVTAPCFRSGVFFDSRDMIQVKYELLRSVASGEYTITQSHVYACISRIIVIYTLTLLHRYDIIIMTKGGHKR